MRFRMKNKPSWVCAAFAALAVFSVIPAAASASPQLTAPTGTTAATGTKIQGTNIGPIRFIASGLTVECSFGRLTGALTKNNGPEIEWTIESAVFQGIVANEQCTSTLGSTGVTTSVGNGTPWCFRASNIAADEFQIRGNKCASVTRSITFALDVPGAECKYERTTATGPIKGTFATHPEDAVISMTTVGAQFAGESTNSFICPPSGGLEMKFTLETDPTTGSSSPIYIS